MTLGDKDKHLTKYLQETRNIWTNGECSKQKGLPRYMCIMNMFDDAGQQKKVLYNSKTDEVIEEITCNPMGALHQIDIIRLQNEIDQVESEIHETRNYMKKLWKPIKYFIPLLCVVMLLLGSCSHDQHDQDPTTYQITDIQLQDSVIHQNVLDRSLGIPSQIRTTFNYQVTLSDVEHVQPDTVVIVPAGAHICPDDFLGEEVQIYNGYLYGTK